MLMRLATQPRSMARTITVDDDLYDRLEYLADDGESVPEVVEELVNIYESSDRFLQQGP